MGAPIHLPMGPPPPPMGNLHSFDPFLPCSSHHVAGSRSRSGTGVRVAPQRDVRSAPGSRSSSLPRNMGSGAASAGTTPTSPPQGWPFDLGGAGAPPAQAGPGLEGLLAGMLGQPAGGAPTQEADQNMLAMIQGVMRQVVPLLGGRPGAANPTTIAQFLNTLPDYSYVAGESLVTDLLMTLAQHITFQDMVAIVGQSPSPATLAGLQAPLRQFVTERLLQGGQATRLGMEAAMLAVADDWYGQMEEMERLATVREDVHFPETLHSFVARRPVELAMLVMEADTEAFTAALGPAVRSLLAEAASLCLHCLGGQEGLEAVVTDRLGLLTEDVGPMIRQATQASALQHLRSFVAGVEGDAATLERWLVRPGPQVAPLQAARTERMAARPPPASRAPPPPQAPMDDMDVDDGPPPPPPSAAQPDLPPPNRPEAVRRRPVVPPEAEATFPASLLAIPVTPAVQGDGLADRTLAVLPPAWAPIIARDSAEGRQVGQPYSDAYLAGQPNKRRKLNSERKPGIPMRGEAVISSCLQDALEQTGLAPGSGEAVAGAAAAPGLQQAVEMYTRQSLQERLGGDSDFQDNKERFPAADGFNKGQ